VHYQTGGEKGLCDTPLPELFRSPSHSIGAIIRGYKSSVTKQINLSDHGGSAWQRNYYEHIIRDEKSYMRISDYIIRNPANWTNDKFYIK
jgi:putative transposase